jgi:hypothetical protein
VTKTKTTKQICREKLNTIQKYSSKFLSMTKIKATFSFLSLVLRCVECRIIRNPPQPLQFYPIPNEKELLDRAQSQPKIEAHISRLQMSRSPGIDIDCATGSLGFIANQRSFLHFEDL